MFTIDYFIEKFKAIPEGLFATGDQYDGNGRCCALGHCDYKNHQGHETEEGKSLMQLFKSNGLATNQCSAYADTIDPIGKYHIIASINNGSQPRYQQPTPKQRILAALYDIKKLQYPELSNTTVEDIINQESFIE